MSERSLDLSIGASIAPSVEQAFGVIEKRSMGLTQSLQGMRLGTALGGDINRTTVQLAKLHGLVQKTANAMKALGGSLAETGKNAAGALCQCAPAPAAPAASVGPGPGGLAAPDKVFSGLNNMFSNALNGDMAKVRLGFSLKPGEVEAATQSAAAAAQRGFTGAAGMLSIQQGLLDEGFTAEVARAGAEVVAKVAAVSNTETGKTGSVIAEVYKQFGKTLKGTAQERFTYIGDLLTKSQFTFNIQNMAQFGEALKPAMAELSKHKVSLAQTATLLGVLNRAGLKGADGGKVLAGVYADMAKASRSLGFDLAKNADGNLDFIDSLQNMRKAVGDFNDLDPAKAARLKQIFGQQGAKGIVQLGKQLPKLGGEQQTLADSAPGSLDKFHQQLLDSTPGQLKLLQNNLGLLGNTLAGSLLPTINAVLPGITAMVAEFGQLTQENPALAQSIMGVVGGLWAFKKIKALLPTADALFGGAEGAGALSRLGGQFGTISNGLSSMALRGAGVFARLGTGIVSVLGIIGSLSATALIVPGLIIGGIAAAGVLIYRYWEPLKALFGGIWDGLVQGVAPVQAQLQRLDPLFERLQFWGEKLSNWFGSLFGNIELPDLAVLLKLPGLKSALEGLKALVSSFSISSIFGPAETTPESLENDRQTGLEIGNSVGNGIGLMAEYAVNKVLGISKALDGLLTAASSFAQSLGPVLSSIKQAWEGFSLQTSIEQATQGVENWLGSFSLAESGAAIIDTLAEGILKNADAAGDSIKEVLGSVREYLPFSDAKKGPLSTLTASGKAIVTTLGDGVKKAGSAPIKKPLSKALAGAGVGLLVSAPLAAKPASSNNLTAKPLSAMEAVAAENRNKAVSAASTISINVNAPITIAANNAVDMDLIADELQERMSEILRRAMIEATGGENDGAPL